MTRNGASRLTNAVKKSFFSLVSFPIRLIRWSIDLIPPSRQAFDKEVSQIPHDDRYGSDDLRTAVIEAKTSFATQRFSSLIALFSTAIAALIAYQSFRIERQLARAEEQAAAAKSQADLSRDQAKFANDEANNARKLVQQIRISTWQGSTELPHTLDQRGIFQSPIALLPGDRNYGEFLPSVEIDLNGDPKEPGGVFRLGKGKWLVQSHFQISSIGAGGQSKLTKANPSITFSANQPKVGFTTAECYLQVESLQQSVNVGGWAPKNGLAVEQIRVNGMAKTFDLSSPTNIVPNVKVRWDDGTPDWASLDVYLVAFRLPDSEQSFR
ncbi:MAG: hypothetical protein AAFU85_20735 [Planctomycetota bacterium]